MLPDIRTERDVAISPTDDSPLTSPTRRQTPLAFLRWLPVAAIALVAVVLLPRLVDYMQHSWDILSFPWQIDFDEGINLNASWLLSQGVNIYRPNPPDHFISSMYPPLYFALNAAAIKLFGLNLASGRALAFAGAIGVGIALWAWVYVETKDEGRRTNVGLFIRPSSFVLRPAAAGALSALLWFSLGPVYVWSTFYKQDMLALALGLTGCMVAARWGAARYTNHDHKLLFWAIVPLSLSFWVKQSSLVPLAAVGLFVLLMDWRLGVRWGLAAVGSILVPFVALDLVLKGGLHTHVLAFDHYGRSAARLGKNLDALWTQHAPMILWAVGFVVLAFVMRSGIGDRRSEIGDRGVMVPLSALYLLVSVPAALLSNTLPTANYNHLLDLLAPLCLAMGIGLGWAWRYLERADGRARAGWVAVAVGVLMLALVQANLVYARPGRAWYSPLTMPLAERAEQMQKLSDLVKQTQGDILSEDNWLLLKNGKRVIFDDPAAMAALANAGAWDQSLLLQDIRRHKFPLVILQYDLTNETYNPRWSDDALADLKANYEIQFRDVLFVHAPRPAGNMPGVQVGCSLGSGVTLEGYTFNSTTANHDDSLPLSLHWQIANTTDGAENLKYYVRLVDGAGTPKWSADLQLGKGKSTSRASSTQGIIETVLDDFSLPVAPELPYGRYRLLLGGYTVDGAGSITPLELKCSGNIKSQPDGSITLADIEVVERWGK